jgi:hypothetical protein
MAEHGAEGPDNTEKPGLGLRRLGAFERNMLVLILAVAFTLVALEAGFRVRAYVVESGLAERKTMIVQGLKDGSYQAGGEVYGFMVRPSADPRLVFELRPNMNWPYQGATVYTNMNGFRDEHYPYAKPPQTVRVFGIGDSVMFGQGAEQGRDYLAQLEFALNTVYNTVNWEVINAGVPDYNTPLEVQMLRSKGLPFSPDLVVLGVVSNDFQIPEFLQFMGMPEHLTAGRYLDPSRSFLKHYVLQRINRMESKAPLLPEEYMSLAGRAAAGRALKDLAAMAREHGFEVMLVFLTPEKGELERLYMRAAETYGFTVADAEPAIQEYMRNNGIADYYASPEMVVPDKHPSPITHRIAAYAIIEAMKKSGLGHRLMDKASGAEAPEGAR